jgi:hypothetical protein
MEAAALSVTGRRERAATLFQALWRGRLARRRWLAVLGLRSTAAVRLQAFARGLVARRRFKVVLHRARAQQGAAVCIQGFWRRCAARRVLAALLREHMAVLAVQTLVRGALLRMRVARRRAQRDAALVFQRVWRGSRGRAVARALKKNLHHMLQGVAALPTSLLAAGPGSARALERQSVAAATPLPDDGSERELAASLVLRRAFRAFLAKLAAAARAEGEVGRKAQGGAQQLPDGFKRLPGTEGVGSTAGVLGMFTASANATQATPMLRQDWQVPVATPQLTFGQRATVGFTFRAGGSSGSGAPSFSFGARNTCASVPAVGCFAPLDLATGTPLAGLGLGGGLVGGGFGATSTPSSGAGGMAALQGPVGGVREEKLGEEEAGNLSLGSGKAASVSSCFTGRPTNGTQGQLGVSPVPTLESLAVPTVQAPPTQPPSGFTGLGVGAMPAPYVFGTLAAERGTTASGATLGQVSTAMGGGSSSSNLGQEQPEQQQQQPPSVAAGIVRTVRKLKRPPKFTGPVPEVPQAPVLPRPIVALQSRKLYWAAKDREEAARAGASSGGGNDLGYATTISTSSGSFAFGSGAPNSSFRFGSAPCPAAGAQPSMGTTAGGASGFALASGAPSSFTFGSAQRVISTGPLSQAGAQLGLSKSTTGAAAPSFAFGAGAALPAFSFGSAQCLGALSQAGAQPSTSTTGAPSVPLIECRFPPYSVAYPPNKENGYDEALMAGNYGEEEGGASQASFGLVLGRGEGNAGQRGRCGEGMGEPDGVESGAPREEEEEEEEWGKDL